MRLPKIEQKPLSSSELSEFRRQFKPGRTLEDDPVLKTLRAERKHGEQMAGKQIDWSESPLAATYPRLDVRIAQMKPLRDAGLVVSSQLKGVHTKFHKRRWRQGTSVTGTVALNAK